MHITKLELKGFRNYSQAQLTAYSGVNVLHGDNGQGKTNLVEAIYYLLRGESFRAATKENFFHINPQSDPQIHVNSFHLKGHILQKNLSHEIQLQVSQNSKQLTHNNKRASSGQIGQEFPIILFSPESLSAIKNGPDERRKLVDDLLQTCAPTHLKVIKEFNRALKHRNRVLKDYRNGLCGLEDTERMLESLDSIYFPLASELVFLRLKSIKAIAEDFNHAMNYICDFKHVDISVEYVISSQNAGEWTRSEIMNALHHRAHQLRTSELGLGTSLVGPHRHDIRFLIAGKDSRYYSSQGQQRALILSFKMAQIRYHYRAYRVHPILLLDDVLSELDSDKRANLIDFLKDIQSQIFLTTTDLSYPRKFGDKHMNVYRIASGMIFSGE